MERKIGMKLIVVHPEMEWRTVLSGKKTTMHYQLIRKFHSNISNVFFSNLDVDAFYLEHRELVWENYPCDDGVIYVIMPSVRQNLMTNEKQPKRQVQINTYIFLWLEPFPIISSYFHRVPITFAFVTRFVARAPINRHNRTKMIRNK